MNDRPDAPAARRNREPILEVLAAEFTHARKVLEIGSGTGQHAVYFARALPHLVWQTSDRSENLAGIRAWIEHDGASNVLPPLALDVLETVQVGGSYDAVYSANTAHIMSTDAVRRMFELTGASLEDGGLFCLYGPVNIDGEFTSESNRRFDASLRNSNPAMGIRDIELLDDMAAQVGMIRVRQYAMPANNQLNVWEKGGLPDD